MLSEKDSLLLKSGNTRRIKMCVINFVSHRDITLKLIGRSAIQRVRLFDVYLVKIGYYINVLQQTACLVVNPITVGNFAFLFNCTPVGRTSDSMMVPI